MKLQLENEIALSTVLYTDEIANTWKWMFNFTLYLLVINFPFKSKQFNKKQSQMEMQQ